MLPSAASPSQTPLPRGCAEDNTALPETDEDHDGSKPQPEDAPPVPPPALPTSFAWRRVTHSPYFRRGAQCGLGTAFIMAVVSPQPVFTALSLDNVIANPALILVLFYLVLLVSMASGLSPLTVAAEQLVGSLLGGTLGIAVTYLVFAINGGSYEGTLTKALTMVLISAIIMFCMTVCRFCYIKYTLTFQFLSLTYAIASGASYHSTHRMYRFTLYWWMYSAIGGSVAFACATLLLPITGGAIVRRRLAATLEHTAAIVRRTLDVMSGDVTDTGLLAAASGEAAQRIGLDSGLYPLLLPLYDSVVAAGQAVQDAHRHLGFASLQLDLYRKQRRFPGRAYSLLTTMTRSLLSTVMMLVYPLQTGTMRVSLIARHRSQLLALAASMELCCRVLGDVYVQNAPASLAVEKLADLEDSFAALAAASRFKGSSLTQDTVALDMVLSLLFTACTRVRHMVVLLPEALGVDQPASLAPVLHHFQAEGSRQWDFTALTQVGTASDPVELLRATLLAAQPRRSRSSAALQLLEQPAPLAHLAPPPPASKPHGWHHKLMAGLQARTGIKREHLALGAQMVAAYTTVLVMIIVPAVNNAFNKNLSWALFVVVSVVEPSTGGAIFKGLQRLTGTVCAGLAGTSTQYLVYLLNGLSYDNTAVKYVGMTVILATLVGLLAAGGLRFPRYSYAFITATLICALTALPGYHTDSPMPKVALWRVLNTCLGVAVEVLAVSLILPVTARHIFRSTMAATLDQMAAVARVAFRSLLPDPPGGKSHGRLLPGGQQQQPQVQPQPQPQQALKQQPVAGGIPRGLAAIRPHLRQRQQQQQQQEAQQQDGQAGCQTGLERQQQQQQRMQQQEEQLPDGADVVIEMVQGGQQPGPDWQQVLPAVRIRPASGGQQHDSQLLQQQRGQQQHEQAGMGSALSSPRPSAPPGWGLLHSPLQSPPLSPTTLSSPSSAKRRRSISAGSSSLVALHAAASPAAACGQEPGGEWPPPGVAPQQQGTEWPPAGVSGRLSLSPQRPSAQQQQQQQLDRCMSFTSDGGHLSIYAKPGGAATFKVIGTAYGRLLPEGLSTAANIVALLQLNNALKFEWYPFHRIHRFPFDSGFRAQRLCRHMLNVLSSVAVFMDAHEVVALPLLANYSSRLQQVIDQLAACLHALAAMVRREEQPDRAIDLVLALEEHAQRLFLSVLAQERDPGQQLSEADVINGLAFLAMLFNAAYVARLLAIALVCTFYATDSGPRSKARALLDKHTRWAVDDRMLQLVTGILGVAIGSSATGSGGPLTPRAPTGGSGGGGGGGLSPRRDSSGGLA